MVEAIAQLGGVVAQSDPEEEKLNDMRLTAIKKGQNYWHGCAGRDAEDQSQSGRPHGLVDSGVGQRVCRRQLHCQSHCDAERILSHNIPMAGNFPAFELLVNRGLDLLEIVIRAELERHSDFFESLKVATACSPHRGVENTGSG